MHALVTIDRANGALRRYEPDGAGNARLTHELVPEEWDTGWEWQLGDIELFRSNPHYQFSVHPPHGPDDPGGSPLARAA